MPMRIHYSFTKSYDEPLEKMSSRNQVITNIEVSQSKIEAVIDIKFNKILADKTKTFKSFNMKISDLTSNKPSSSYEQHSSDIIKWPHFESHEKSSYASQFIKRLSSMTIEGDTFLQIQKWWDYICSAFWKYQSTNNICPEYKSLSNNDHQLPSFFLPPDTHYKFTTVKETYEVFSRELRVHLVKDDTIPSSKAPK